MARSNDNLKFAGLALVVIAAGFGVGLYGFGGQHSATSSDSNIIPASAPQAEPKTAVQTPPPVNITPHRRNTDYTAPGAPAIRIVEEQTPSLTVTHLKPTVPPHDTQTSHATDPEASQEAAPTSVSSSSNTTDTQTGSETTGTGAPPTAPLIPPPANATPATPTSASVSTDIEHTGGHATPPATDSPSAGKAQFRVQAGSFATSDNARALADALHSQGYAATTRAEQSNGKTVYNVQVGAYRSRTAADKAAADLQKSGYPAYTSSIGP